jgi:hypothetical protein
MILSHLIPSNKISKNVIESTEVLKKEGLYPNLLNFKLYQLDNFTDALMLNIAVSVDSDNPVNSAMMNYWYNLNSSELAYETERVANNDVEGLTKKSYGRYWQGYLVYLRPLLCVFNYSQIRILYYVLLSSLLAVCLFLIKQRIGLLPMIFFLLTMVIINFPIIPLSMQFSTVFYIAFISIIIILIKKHKISNTYYSLFFIIGGCTSFLDLLSTPLITLGLPLTILLLIIDEKNSKLKTAIVAPLIWVSGYGAIWASKWLIGGLVGQNILDDVMRAAAMRTSNHWKDMEMTIPNIMKFIYDVLVQYSLLWPFIFMVLVFVLFIIFTIKRGVVKENLYLLPIVFMVPVWYLVLRNHSIQHGWMTWRAMAVTLFSSLLFLSNVLDLKKLLLPFKKKN